MHSFTNCSQSTTIFPQLFSCQTLTRYLNFDFSTQYWPSFKLTYNLTSSFLKCRSIVASSFCLSFLCNYSLTVCILPTLYIKTATDVESINLYLPHCFKRTFSFCLQIFYNSSPIRFSTGLSDSSMQNGIYRLWTYSSITCSFDDIYPSVLSRIHFFSISILHTFLWETPSLFPCWMYEGYLHGNHHVYSFSSVRHLGHPLTEAS